MCILQSGIIANMYYLTSQETMKVTDHAVMVFLGGLCVCVT